MQEFQVCRLAASEARVAYPLVQAAAPAVGLDAWLGYVRRAARASGGRNGIMVARRHGQRFPCGLFCYRCHADLVHGALVTADHFVAVDILDPAPVVGAMVAELEQLGGRLRCNAIRSIVHSRAAVLSTCLERSGHRQEATNFVKALPP